MQIGTFYVKAFESYRLTDRHTYIHTNRQTDTAEIILSRRFAGGH